MYFHLRWWLTMQCAASSLSNGTSNKAWWNSSSLAVGRLLGSTSRHFWMNSWKSRDKQTLRISLWKTHPGFKYFALPHSPVATGPLGTEWHCLWLLGTRRTNLHYSGFPTQPSGDVMGRKKKIKNVSWMQTHLKTLVITDLVTFYKEDIWRDYTCNLCDVTVKSRWRRPLTSKAHIPKE